MTDTGCPSDDTLLPVATGETVAEELRGHVEACSDCRSRIDRLRTELDEMRSVSALSAALVSPGMRAAAPRPPVIGKYLVVGELDSGGQSIVYRALHPTLDKELVIKLSREPVHSESDDRDLLVREGKMLASLEHPNLARVYDLDFHGDLPFIVMEYVRGRNLADYAGNKLPGRDAASFIAGVARALAVVHRHGIVHQDIKPRNILIDENNRPRLIDFGLARLRHAWDNPDEPFGGTPAFTSPEQARGDAAQVTIRSDLFSLGGVLYFLLAGKAPFDARTPTDSLHKAARCDYDLQALDAVRPRRLQMICRRALAANPADRYDSAEALADDLEAVATPLKTRRGILIGSVSFVAVVAGAWLGRRTFQDLPLEPDLRVEVVRGDESMDLHHALPLNPKTDMLKFTAHMPAGLAAGIYGYDTVDGFTILPTSSETDGGVQTVRYPAPGRAAPLEGAGRTEIVIVAAAKTQQDLDDFVPKLKAALREEMADMQPLPERLAVRFNQHGVRGQSFGDAKPDPTAGLNERLDRLVRRLRAAVPIVDGVAFRY